MKKLSMVTVLLGLLLGVNPVDAVSKVRVLKCSIPKLHKKFNCTAEERAIGKKWLAGVSIAAAIAALAAIAGLTATEIRRAKADAIRETAPRPIRPTWREALQAVGAGNERGRWDETLFNFVLSWLDDRQVALTINEVEQDLDNVSMGGINAAIYAFESWVKPRKDVGWQVEAMLRGLRAQKLKEIELQSRPRPQLLTPPPPLDTSPMRPNPTEWE